MQRGKYISFIAHGSKPLVQLKSSGTIFLKSYLPPNQKSLRKFQLTHTQAFQRTLNVTCWINTVPRVSSQTAIFVTHKTYNASFPRTRLFCCDFPIKWKLWQSSTCLTRMYNFHGPSHSYVPCTVSLSQQSFYTGTYKISSSMVCLLISKLWASMQWILTGVATRQGGCYR